MSNTDSITCRDGSGCIYSLTDCRLLVEESRRLWAGKSIEPELWVKVVLDRFASEETGSAMALDCVSSWPLLVLVDGRLRLCGKVLHSNFLFEEETTAECVKEHMGGYDQEVVVVHFLKRCYFSSEGVNQGMQKLKNDVRYLYEVGIFRRNVDPCIKYLHDRLCRGNVLIDFIQWVGWMPIHPDLAHAIFEYGRWLAILSQGDVYKGTDTFVQMAMFPLYIDNEEEWSVVERCKRLCGQPWRRRAVMTCAEIRYGRSKWDWDWRSTQVRYCGKTYHERVDERVLWVSVWLLQIANGIFPLHEGPMHLLAVVANSLH